MNSIETSTDTQKLTPAALPAFVITFLLFALMQEVIETDAMFTLKRKVHGRAFIFYTKRRFCSG